MHELLLPGIPGSNPIGAMAAFGLFRIIAREQPFGEARLAWRFDSDWRPVLHTDQVIDADSVGQFLIERQPQRTEAAFLTWSDDIKCDPTNFRVELRRVRDERMPVADRPTTNVAEDVEFLCAFGSDAITAKSTSDVKPTAFHMTAGQQRFLKSSADLSASLDPRKRTSKRQSKEQRISELGYAWRETLLGPWQYHDTEHSLGWDPTTEGLYALSDRSPSSAGPRSVRGAVWLAFESLPLFPSVPGSRKLLTTGFDEDSKTFLWPIWDIPLTLDSFRTLLARPELIDGGRELADLKRRGIRAIFSAQCLRDGNGRGTFRNAVEIR